MRVCVLLLGWLFWIKVKLWSVALLPRWSRRKAFFIVWPKNLAWFDFEGFLQPGWHTWTAGQCWTTTNHYVMWYSCPVNSTSETVGVIMERRSLTKPPSLVFLSPPHSFWGMWLRLVYWAQNMRLWRAPQPCRLQDSVSREFLFITQRLKWEDPQNCRQKSSRCGFLKHGLCWFGAGKEAVLHFSAREACQTVGCLKETGGKKEACIAGVWFMWTKIARVSLRLSKTWPLYSFLMRTTPCGWEICSHSCCSQLQSQATLSFSSQFQNFICFALIVLPSPHILLPSLPSCFSRGISTCQARNGGQAGVGGLRT